MDEFKREIIDLTESSDDEEYDGNVIFLSESEVANDSEMSWHAPTYAAMVKRGEHTCSVTDDTCVACVVQDAHACIGNLDSDSD